MQNLNPDFSQRNPENRDNTCPLRCGIGSGSVTYRTVCSLATPSLRLRKQRIGVSGGLAPPEDILLRRIRLHDF